MIDTVEGLLDTLAGVNGSDMRYQAQKLRAIREWAVQQLHLDYEVGDAVTITEDLFIDPEDGRHHYAEAAREGAFATVTALDFNAHHKVWQIEIKLDREWSTSSFDGGRRYWHGPTDETPDGFEVPSQFDQETYPAGRKHVFWIRPHRVRARKDDDEQPSLPFGPVPSRAGHT